MGGKLTQAPATPSLVERVKEASYGAAQSYLKSTPWRGALRGDAFLAGVAWVISDPGFAALEAQQARIAELEKALTWIALFAEMRGRDSDRTFAKVARGAVQTIAEHSRQALSSQGRREGEQDSSSRSQPCADAQERSPGSLHSGGIDDDCPHAGTFRYCAECPVSPCPLGLGRGDNQ